MSKKTFQLVSAIIGGVQAIAVAVVTYTAPEYATAINGAINIPDKVWDEMKDYKVGELYDLVGELTNNEER